MTSSSPQSLDLVALSADVANIWVTGLRYLLAHPSAIGGGGSSGFGGGVLCEGGGVAVEGSLGSKIRCEWLTTEFALVDEDGHGIVTEDVAVSTICKLCPGTREAKVIFFFLFVSFFKSTQFTINFRNYPTQRNCKITVIKFEF